jgi:anti-sigma B factor antagonist
MENAMGAFASQPPAKMQLSTRRIGSVAVVDINGAITYGDGSAKLHETVRDLLNQDDRKILLNLREVHYIDSSGLGELMRSYTSVRNQGGEMKVANLTRRVHDLLKMTRMDAIFRINDDETAAIGSFDNSQNAS